MMANLSVPMSVIQRQQMRNFCFPNGSISILPADSRRTISSHGALIYLENFAPDEARERFEERIRSLFETKWIIELVDMAMLKIREYPDKGALYCEIISKAYLNRFKYRESEMLEVLNMERSTYYDRKKEAILLFGLSLWGTAIPKLKDFLESAREEEALCYCEC